MLVVNLHQTFSFYLTNLPVKPPGVRREQSVLFFEVGNVVLYQMYVFILLYIGKGWNGILP